MMSKITKITTNPMGSSAACQSPASALGPFFDQSRTLGQSTASIITRAAAQRIFIQSSIEFLLQKKPPRYVGAFYFIFRGNEKPRYAKIFHLLRQ